MDNCGGAAAGGRAQIAVAMARELEVTASHGGKGAGAGRRSTGMVLSTKTGGREGDDEPYTLGKDA
jgi:hypothetical protein